MPGGDRTGPWGGGPRTGRGAGFCAGFGVPGYLNSTLGRGFGMGFGRGYRHMFWANGLPGWTRFGRYPASYYKADPETEKQGLKDEADALQAELDMIKKRLSKLETGETTK